VLGVRPGRTRWLGGLRAPGRGALLRAIASAPVCANRDECKAARSPTIVEVQGKVLMRSSYGSVREQKGAPLESESLVPFVAIAVGGVTFLVIVPRLLVGWLRSAMSARIAKRFSSTEIVLSELAANAFGVESQGRAQVRGNGALVLTESALVFLQAVPDEELRIPLDAILETSLVRSHLGKTVGKNLVHVRFIDEGKTDSVAWWAPDPAAWVAKIDQLRGA
jgi:hypothetical protein